MVRFQREEQQDTGMLTASTRLGPYEIVAPLGAGGMGGAGGAGGMGVVYRGRDTRRPD
jgi:hypothetical protein